MDKTNLGEVGKRIELLISIDEPSEDEVKELQELNAIAGKLKAKQDGLKTVVMAQQDAKEKQEEETQAKINEAVKAAVALEAAKSRRLPSDVPFQTQYHGLNKYEGMDRVDLALFLDVQSALKAKGVRYVSGDEIRVDDNAVKALAFRVSELKDDNTEQGREDVAYTKYSFKAATNVTPTKEAIEAAIKTEGDPNYSSLSLGGSDWVGTAYSTELWKAIRQTPAVVGKIPSEVIPDGYSSKTWPLESTDMTWYKVAEATGGNATLGYPVPTVTSSKLATANKNITVAKMGARGVYTGELEEDSLIRFSSQLRAQLELSGQEILESLVIDGDIDTSTNTNINIIDGNAGATSYYILFDGFRKLALVTNTDNALSASGSLEIEDFIKTMKLMGTAGLAGSDPSKLNFICDGNTYYAMAQLAEVKTKDVNSAATVENGFVQKLWGVGVLPSWQMHRAGSAKRMANSAGKCVTTDSGNTLGAALCVRWDQWKLAYKRRMTMEVTRIANADAWEIVALCRLGLGYRDTEASAILYNIGL